SAPTVAEMKPTGRTSAMPERGTTMSGCGRCCGPGMHGRVATVPSGPETVPCSVGPHVGEGASVGGAVAAPEPDEPGSLPPAPKPRSLQSGCWITQVAPTPGVEGVCSEAAGGVAAEEVAAAATKRAATAAATATRARIGWRMGVLPVGYPGEEGIWST